MYIQYVIAALIMFVVGIFFGFFAGYYFKKEDKNGSN